MEPEFFRFYGSQEAKEKAERFDYRKVSVQMKQLIEALDKDKRLRGKNILRFQKRHLIF